MTALAPGVLLLASPLLGDPNFMRSVIYLMEHNEHGSLGLIVNRPLDIPLSDIWEDCPDDIGEIKLCAEGGPVERDRGLLLHGLEGIPGAKSITEGVFIGGDPGELYRRSESSPETQGPRLFLGHSGWGPGQLLDELQQGSWLVRPGHPNLLLHAKPPDNLWKEGMDVRRERPQPSLN